MLKRLRFLAPFLLTLGLLGTVAPTASASSAILCTGYRSCAAQGMSASGYAQHSGTMYWRMYTGHNCTNYAAYRMVRSGMPNVRPWSGDGNASNWGRANPAITDGTPAVGAVAWWGANVPPAGSAGHVAYVEQVLSPSEIVVSQDSWGGTFSWSRITRKSGYWPSGFIHFHDVLIDNTVRPTVSGTPAVGAVLTAAPGTWSPSGTSLSYQWRADGVNITGATGSTFTPRPAQLGKQISVQVTGSATGMADTRAYSKRTDPVARGTFSSVAPPVISGTPQVGSTLTVTAGQWAPVPRSVSYQWNADGVPLSGETSPALAVGPALVGKQVSATVTVRRRGYTRVSTNAQTTGVVVPGEFAVTRSPTATRTPRLGETLAVDTGAYSPAGGDVNVQWLRAGQPIAGATGTSYQVTAADLGSWIRARVTVEKPGYTPLAVNAPAGRAKSLATLHTSATTAKRPSRAWVSVTAEAPEVATVTGTIRLRWHGTTLREVVLRGGTRTVAVDGLPSGRHSIKVHYTGSRTVAPATTYQTVLVR